MSSGFSVYALDWGFSVVAGLAEDVSDSLVYIVLGGRVLFLEKASTEMRMYESSIRIYNPSKSENLNLSPRSPIVTMTIPKLEGTVDVLE